MHINTNKIIFMMLLFNPMTFLGATTLTFLPPISTDKGSSDASAAIKIQDFYLVGDDEVNFLRLYPAKSGRAIKEWSLNSLGAALKKELDLESMFMWDETLYLLGSHSNKSSGKNAQKHSGHLLSMKLTGEIPDLNFSELKKFSAIDELLIEYDVSNLHQLGENYLGFAKGLAKGQIPESVEGFSIEGLSFDPIKKNFLLGFRAPLVKDNHGYKAIIVPIHHHQDINDITLSSVNPPYLINLGGRGIRDMFLLNEGAYIILAGPAGPTDFDDNKQFALFYWELDTDPKLITDDLDKYLKMTQGSFEAIAEAYIQDNELSALLLMDNGDTLVDGVVSKKNDVQKQKFYGEKITIKW